MLRKTLLAALLAAVALPAQAQSLGDIRGQIDPSDNRSARFLNSFPQTEDQAFVPYQPVASGDAIPQYAPASSSNVTVYQPILGPSHKPVMHTQPDETRGRNFGLRDPLLATRPGLEFGLSLAGYHYQEPFIPPGDRVNIGGIRYGANLAATVALPDPLHLNGNSSWIAEAETRFSYAPVDYNGSGKLNDRNDFLSESRFTLGHDFLYGDVALVPYAGIGYRYLFNDLRGTSSTGLPGYRRQSQYLYAPLGLTTRFDLFNDGSRIALNGEYDLFLHGKQKSFVQDIGAGDALENTQKHGHGWRGSIMYETTRWSLGPYFSYWNIGDSQGACNASLTCGYEPRNQTVEYGLKANFRFISF